MSDRIQLLPDSVANQIAAGEVIQRPASVVKELMENAIDAESKTIQVLIKDAGKTLIQVIDDGFGMSATDARLAFERHATSKIREADDLFSIRSMGFRGEALPSIAAVAQLTIKTRAEGEELGTALDINASEVVRQEPVGTPQGTNISVKNLFFNIPARRKFLKSASTEHRHILQQFQQIALSRPDIKFTLSHNGQAQFNLPPGKLKRRLANIYGKTALHQFISVNTETTLVNIYGFVGTPESAAKRRADQYLFVNRRYMRSGYFHKAISQAYERILPDDQHPKYFIFFEIDPAQLDINIHPTKTEINFENSPAIYKILHAAIKEALGKSNITPSMDFDEEMPISMPSALHKEDVKPPEVDYDPNYNPFDQPGKGGHQGGIPPRQDIENWEALYKGFEEASPETGQVAPKQSSMGEEPTQSGFFQFKQKYIITSIKSGLLIVDQYRAHVRILAERFARKYNHASGAGQKDLFPETVNLQAEHAQLLRDLLGDLAKLGFEINELSQNTFIINAIPSEIGLKNAGSLLDDLLQYYAGSEQSVVEAFQERIFLSLAKAAAVRGGKQLSAEEMRSLIDELYACQDPNYTPDGKKISHVIRLEELGQFFS